MNQGIIKYNCFIFEAPLLFLSGERISMEKDHLFPYGLTNEELDYYLEEEAEECDYDSTRWGVIIGKVVYTHNRYLVFSGDKIDPPIHSYCIEGIHIPENFEEKISLWDNNAGVKLNAEGYLMPWIYLEKYNCPAYGFSLKFGNGENLAEWSLVVKKKDFKEMS